MIEINPDLPDQTGIFFGDGNVMCGVAIQYDGEEITGVSFYYNTDKSLEIGEQVAENATLIEELPIPNVVMFFKNTESLDVVINCLQILRESMETINGKKETEKQIESERDKMS